MTADTSLGAEFGATLDVTLGKLAQAVDRLTRRDEQEAQLWQDVHMVPILAGGLTGSPAAGTVVTDLPDRMGPHDPYWWDVRRLSCWGFTAGSVNVFLNDATGNGELVANFPQAGQFTWSGQVFLAPRDRLVVITASAITGSVFVAGQAVEISSTMLPRYLL